MTCSRSAIRSAPSLVPLVVLIAVGCGSAMVRAEDWNQWRGPRRDGLARSGPPLISRLPQGGLRPRWINHDIAPWVQNAGWSSPVVADGRVYLFAHKKTRADQTKLPPVKYPYLAPEDRSGMTKKDYDEYEQLRRDEQEQRSRSFRFEEILLCLDADNGELLWKNVFTSRYTRFFQSGTPAVVDGRVLLLGAGRVARAINAETGDDQWATPLPGPFRDQPWHSSFAVVDRIAAVVCSSLFGLDVETGQIVWQAERTENQGSHTSPVVWRHAGADYFVAHVKGGETVAVEATSGLELWRVRSDAVHSTPVIAGDSLITFGNSRKKGLRAFRMTQSGAELQWVYQGIQDPGSSPVVVGPVVFVQGGPRLAAIELETGRPAWTTLLKSNNPRYTSLVATPHAVIYAFDSVLMFGASGERFESFIDARIDETGLLAERDDFRRLWDLDELEKTVEGQKESQRLQRAKFLNHGPLPCASPALADGRLYLRLKKGIACYDLQ